MTPSRGASSKRLEGTRDTPTELLRGVAAVDAPCMLGAWRASSSKAERLGSTLSLAQCAISPLLTGGI